MFANLRTRAAAAQLTALSLATAASPRNHDVSGTKDLRRTHAPNVEVVKGNHLIGETEIGLHSILRKPVRTSHVRNLLDITGQFVPQVTCRSFHGLAIV